MDAIKENLPQELLETLNSREFDDEAGLLIESVKYLEKDIHLTFSIRFYDEETIPHLWQIIIHDIEEEHITREWTQDIAIYSKHILLLEYHDLNPELYFKGTTQNDERLFIDLYKSISELSTDFDYISRYILSPERVKVLCSQGHGLFARGPKTILKIYADEIAKQNIKPIFIGNESLVNIHINMKLLMLGESYFIGSKFTFERKQ